MYEKVKLIRILKALTIVVILTSISFFLYKMFFEGHSPKSAKIEETDYSIFKIQAISKMFPMVGYYKGRNDILYDFHYIQDTTEFGYKYHIMVWKFINTENIPLSKAFISQEEIYDPFINDYEILGGKGGIERRVRYNCDFKNDFELNVDKRDTISQQKNEENYKWIYGSIRNVLICDNKKPQIFVSNTYTNQPLLIIITKRMNSIHLIIVSSEYHFIPEDIINIFNL